MLFERALSCRWWAFVLQAVTTHDGQVYVFFTYDQPGKEAEMRDWFGSLLQGVSFA
jgi:hypothetical protein